MHPPAPWSRSAAPWQWTGACAGPGAGAPDPTWAQPGPSPARAQPSPWSYPRIGQRAVPVRRAKNGSRTKSDETREAQPGQGSGPRTEAGARPGPAIRSRDKAWAPEPKPGQGSCSRTEFGTRPAYFSATGGTLHLARRTDGIGSWPVAPTASGSAQRGSRLSNAARGTTDDTVLARRMGRDECGCLSQSGFLFKQ
jgi:hypothetical protein